MNHITDIAVVPSRSCIIGKKTVSGRGFIWTKLTLYWTMCQHRAQCIVVQSKVNRIQGQGQWKSKMAAAAAATAAEQLKQLRMAFYAESCVVSSEDIVAVDSVVKRWRDQRKRRAETRQQLL